jgi:hypothetical protein
MKKKLWLLTFVIVMGTILAFVFLREYNLSFVSLGSVNRQQSETLADHPGEIAFENEHYQADFSQLGLRYLPKSGDALLEDWSFSYRLTQINIGGDSWPVLGGQPLKANQHRVEYTRQWGITEAYLADERGVEQLFVLDQPLGEGDLTLLGQVETGLTARLDDSGEVHFFDGGWEVLRYGAAVAFDASGSTTNLRTKFDGQQLTLTVPGAWLTTAVYPVTLDPFIGGDILISVAENSQFGQSMAYNDDDDEWLVVWQGQRGGASHIYGQRVGSNGSLLGDVIMVWEGAGAQGGPDVAYDTTNERYLVVWKGSKAIQGRVLRANGTIFSGLITISTDTVDLVSPDVAFNPVSDQYLVVWTRRMSADNGDIYGRKVGVDGTPDGVAFDIRTHASDDSSPRLIAYPAAYNGQYLLVWRNNNTGHYNILGRRIDKDGNNEGSVFAISQGSQDESFPELALNSSNGQALVVWVDTDSGNGDIMGRLINNDGSRETTTTIVAGVADQQVPGVAYNAVDNEYLVVWDEGELHQGQRVLADLSLAGSPILISDVTGLKTGGSLAFGADRYLTAWADHRSGLGDIYGQRIAVDGSLLGTEIGISAAYEYQGNPALAFGSAEDQWLVVWEDYRDAKWDIIGQFVDRDGILIGEPIPICTESLSSQYYPDVAYNLHDDQFLVVWEDGRNGQDDIYAQRVDASDGSLLGEIRITNQSDDQWESAVAYSEATNQYLVVWKDNRDDPDSNIYGRRLNADGTFSDSFVLDICLRGENQGLVDVAYSPTNDQYLVVWVDELQGVPGYGVSGQLVSAGSPWRVGTNFDIITGILGEPETSAACNTANGEYLVVWNALVALGNNDIFGRRVGATGQLLGTDAIPISTQSNQQIEPNVSFGSVSQWYYVTWDDFRNGINNIDIYGQSLSASGDLLFTDAVTNVPAWQFPDDQVEPASAADPYDDRTLLVWEDWRNGATDVYGRLGEPASGFKIYLPLVNSGD